MLDPICNPLEHGRVRTLKQAAFLVVVFFSLAGFSPRAVSAGETSDLKTLEVFSLYGAGAGTVVGLATVPFSKEIKTMFIGTSVGLVLGIIAGVYHINNRDNPQNPFNNNFQPFPAEDPNYPKESNEEGMQSPDKAPPAILVMASYSVFRF